jgi:hypothetical protein
MLLAVAQHFDSEKNQIGTAKQFDRAESEG